MIKTENGDEIKIYENASVWKTGKQEITLTKEINSKIISVELGDEKIPDSNSQNNSWELK
jgi:hypothetical protein